MNKRHLSLLVSALFLMLSFFGPVTASRAAEKPLILERPSPAEFDPGAGQSMQVMYFLSQDADTLIVQVKAFTGAVIRQEVTEQVRAGPGQWVWDGTDDRRQIVPQGQYQIFVIVDLPDGRRVSDDILVLVAQRIAPTLAPPALPAPQRYYRISGEVSGFYRRDTQEDEGTYEGRFGVHGVYDRAPFVADVNFYLIQRDREQTNFDNCYASFSYDTEQVTFLSVFRKSLGAFTDPFRLFDDMRTERFKSGMRLDVRPGPLTITGLGFSAEGDTLSDEKGFAARMEIPLFGRFTLGGSFVGRYYNPEGFEHDQGNLVGGVDGVLDLGRGFVLATEVAVSDDDETDEQAMAGRIEARYEGGRLRGIIGYQDLGEHFKADCAYISSTVRTDARGVDGVLDYYPGKVLFAERVGIVLRSYYYQRKSSAENLYEVDANARFGVGQKDDFMLGMIVHEDETSDYTAVRARHIHRFTERWSNELGYSLNLSDGSANHTHTVREIVSYSQPPRRNVSGGVQWIHGQASGRDPSHWDELSLLAWGEWEGWFCETEGRFIFDEGTDSNFFVKLGYRIEFLKRYEASVYVAYGDRASREISHTIEIGAEARF